MIEDIEKMLRSEPFQTFQIVMTSGDKFRVENPMLVSIGKTIIQYFYPKSDRYAHLRKTEIAYVETTEEAAK